ncbi:hypothetical protein DFJ74DRAFT_685646 [Hyaloraphidium curvatum]|nr:hypothetical protein DFJ74DRAFT_685646 [Hyaloraphidium curvatum]
MSPRASDPASRRRSPHVRAAHPPEDPWAAQTRRQSPFSTAPTRQQGRPVRCRETEWAREKRSKTGSRRPARRTSRTRGKGRAGSAGAARPTALSGRRCWAPAPRCLFSPSCWRRSRPRSRIPRRARRGRTGEGRRTGRHEGSAPRGREHRDGPPGTWDRSWGSNAPTRGGIGHEWGFGRRGGFLAAADRRRRWPVVATPLAPSPGHANSIGGSETSVPHWNACSAGCGPGCSGCRWRRRVWRGEPARKDSGPPAGSTGATAGTHGRHVFFRWTGRERLARIGGRATLDVRIASEGARRSGFAPADTDVETCRPA